MAEKAEAAVRGEFAEPSDTHEKHALLADHWLRWSQDDSSAARLQWSYLQEHGVDRDEYVLRLWRSFEEKNREAKKYFKQEFGPWSYYERHFFRWFLSRFDLRAARSVAGARRWGPALNALLALSAIGVAACALRRPALDSSLRLLPLVVVAVLLGGLLLGVRPYDYVQSLIPRLAATVGIGYLFLFNAPQVVRIVYQSPRAAWQLWTAFGVLLVAAYGYVVVHVARRVYPPLATAALLVRSLDVWLLAVGYSAIGLLLTGPLLFSGSLLFGSNGPYTVVAARPQHLALVAAIALNLGVVLQLAWDEKPLTEPL